MIYFLSLNVLRNSLLVLTDKKQIIEKEKCKFVNNCLQKSICAFDFGGSFQKLNDISLDFLKSINDNSC